MSAQTLDAPFDIVADGGFVRRIGGLLCAISLAIFCETGVFYYVIDVLAHLLFQNPVPIILTLAASCMMLLQAPGRWSTYFFTFFLGLTIYLCISSRWSPSTVYLQQKLPATIFLPPLCLLAGYSVQRWGHSRLMAWTFIVLAIGAWIAWNASDGVLLRYGFDAVANYQHFGIASGLAAALALNFAVRSPRRIERGLALAALVPILWLLGTCGGRTGVLMFVVALPAIWAKELAKAAPVVALFAAVGLLVALVGHDVITDQMKAVAANPDVPATVSRIAEGLTFGERYDLLSREDFKDAALKLWAANPVFGVGWAGFPRAAGFPDLPGYYPHNIALELLAETGLVGVVSAAMLFGVVLWRFGRAYLRFPSYVGSQIALVITACGLANAMVSGEWPASRTLFLGVGMMLASCDNLEFLHGPHRRGRPEAEEEGGGALVWPPRGRAPRPVLPGE